MNRPSFSLDVKTHEFQVPYSKTMRRVRVLLPKDYTEEVAETYPVVYFHDGQNVLYDEEAFSGYSWQVLPIIAKHPDLAKMIVVAIDNDDAKRMDEYASWTFQMSDTPDKQFGGMGAEYAAFVMEVVKPFIDENYRTKSDRAHTAVIGSSLGGNITQFMGLAYPEQIGCLGVFSSANWIYQDAFNDYMERQQLNPEQRVYIYVGTEEGDDTDKTLTSGNIKQAYINSSLLYYRQLIEKGVAVENIAIEVVSGAVHNEEAWALFLTDCLHFLSKNW